MSANSKIEWTNHTFNPWIGCTKVSPGCANCYAETRDKRHLHGPESHWGKGVPRVRTSAANWKEPLRWNRQHLWCPHCGFWREPGDHKGDLVCPKCLSHDAELRRPRVFSASMADWLDDEVPIEWPADLLALIHATPNLDWLLLTKRPENWRFRIEGARDWNIDREQIDGGFHDRIVNWMDGAPPANVWLGTTVEDQARADERIPALLAIPARVRFLSCEPLLEAVNLDGFLPWNAEHQSKGLPDPLGRALRSLTDVPGIDWVIAGGESGPGARPMHPQWARSLRDQCAAAGVPFLFKQWGEWLATDQGASDARQYGFLEPDGRFEGEHGDGTIDSAMVYRVGKHAAGRLLDGVEHSAFPE